MIHSSEQYWLTGVVKKSGARAEGISVQVITASSRCSRKRTGERLDLPRHAAAPGRFVRVTVVIKQLKNLVPRISETERAALEAGTVWVDGEFFSGRPDFQRMLAEPYPRLDAREQEARVAFVEKSGRRKYRLMTAAVIAR